MTCEHSPYWIGAYGNCMACRAESAEADRDRLTARLATANARVVELEVALGPFADAWENGQIVDHGEYYRRAAEALRKPETQTEKGTT